ncbi:sugar ABC transporter substrate-binding protein, partial [Burkholderia sp. Tr-20355]|nr:sugar ABC transporter substrate-binding protein [Burkholderia sp. Tr-20355]
MTNPIVPAAVRRLAAPMLVLTACVWLSGCALAPGMKMSPSYLGWLA